MDNSISHRAPPRRFTTFALRDQALPVALAAILLLLVGAPIASVLIGGVTPSGLPLDRGWTLAHYGKVWSSPYTYRLLGNTVIFACGATVMSVLLGGTLAWLTERTDLPGARLFRTAILIPMAAPFLLLAIAWVLLMSPNIGLIGQALARVSETTIYSLGGMIFVQGLGMVPLAYLLLAPAMRNMNPSFEEAASTAGASPGQTFRRITLPFLTPALVSIVLLQVIIGMLTFDVPAIIGLPAKTPVISSEIFRLMNPTSGDPGYGQAGAFNSSMFVVLGIGLLAYFHVTRRADRFATLSGKGFRATRIHLRGWTGAALAFAFAYFVLAVILPFLAILWVSLTPYYSGFQWDLLERLSFRSYADVLRNPRLQTALVNSLIIAFSVSIAVVALTLLVAWVVVRARARWVRVLDVLAMAPMGIPHLMMGVALIFIAFSIRAVPLYGTIWIIALGHLVVYLPEATRMMQTALLQIHADLEDSARISGASLVQILLRIVAPLIAPAIAASFLWVFTHSLREFSIALMLRSGTNEVLSTILYSYWENGRPETAAAMAIMLMLALGALIGLGQIWTKRDPAA